MTVKTLMEYMIFLLTKAIYKDGKVYAHTWFDTKEVELFFIPEGDCRPVRIGTVPMRDLDSREEE